MSNRTFYNIPNSKQSTEFDNQQNSKDLSPPNTFECLHCNSVIKYRNSFRTHIKIHMTDLENETLDTKANILQKLAASKRPSSENTGRSSFIMSTFVPSSKISMAYSESNTDNPYKCSYCPYSTVLMRCLKDHLKSEHSNKLTFFNCKLCNTTLKTQRILERHIKNMHEKTKCLECPECDFKTKHKASLKVHMYRHEDKLSLLCETCGFKASNTKSLARHSKRHTGIKDLFCCLCDYRCFNKSELSKHMTVYHSNDRPYACDVCDYRTKAKEHLKYHKLTHSDYKPFACDICDYRCIQKWSLVSHMKTHSLTRERFYCSTCGIGFGNRTRLRVHELAHTNIFLHICEICKATFATKHGLDVHTRLHTGEGRMFCYECSYSTTHKANFIEHVNKTCSKAKHAKENLKHCYHCNFASSHRSNFISHVTKCSKSKKWGVIIKRKI